MGDLQPTNGEDGTHTPTHGSDTQDHQQTETPAVNARVVLGENLTWLMSQRPELATPAAVEAATAKSNEKVGRSSIDRAKNGVANLTIENLEAVAHAFGREAWELLRPGLSVAGSTPTTIHPGAPTLERTLKGLSPADLSGLGQEEIEQLVSGIRTRAGELRLLAAAKSLLLSDKKQVNE